MFLFLNLYNFQVRTPEQLGILYYILYNFKKIYAPSLDLLVFVWKKRLDVSFLQYCKNKDNINKRHFFIMKATYIVKYY